MAGPNDLIAELDLKSDPRPAQLLGEAGFLWSYLGRWAEAETVFKALTTLIPHDAAGYLGLAEVYLMQNQYDQAHKQADAAIETALARPDGNSTDQSTTARAYVVAAKALLHQGKTEQARQAFAHAVELDKDGPSGRHAADMLENGQMIGLLKNA